MRYLIDTQIAIWAKENNLRLKPSVRSILEDLENDIYVSAFSLQEIAIKHQLAKLPNFMVSVEAFAQTLIDDDFSILSISNAHIFNYNRIPFHDDHRDPFDRFILSVALTENMIIITADEKFKRYEPLVKVMLV